MFNKFITYYNKCYNYKPETLQEPSPKHIRRSLHDPRFIPPPIDP